MVLSATLIPLIQTLRIFFLLCDLEGCSSSVFPSIAPVSTVQIVPWHIGIIPDEMISLSAEVSV